MAKISKKTTKIKQSPKRPAEERRRQLLAAAQRLFMKKGFRSTSIEDIARQAGLTKGAFYFHFNKKEDILYELLVAMHSEVMETFGVLPDGRSNPTDLLRILFQKNDGGDTPEFGAFLDFWAEAMKIPRVRKHLEHCLLESNSLMVRKIDRAYGKTPRARSDLGVLLLALWDGLSVRRMMFKDSVDFGRQMKMISKMMEGLTPADGKQRK